MRTLLAIALVAVFATSAHADDDFDPAGWTLLRAENVRSAGPHKVFVGYTGTLDRLAVVALSGTATIESVKMYRRGGSLDVDEAVGRTLDRDHEAYSFEIDHAEYSIGYFTIDLEAVEGRPRLAVFGRDSSAAPADPATTRVWNSSGWIKLGAGKLRGDETDTVRSRVDTLLDQIALVPTEDLELTSLVVNLVDPAGTGTFLEQDSTLWRKSEPYIIDLTTQPTPVGVDSVRLHYFIHGSSTAKVLMYGVPRATVKSTTKPTSAAPASDDESWTLIGEDDVDLVDEEIEIRRNKSTWSEIKLVVDGDEVTLEAVELELGGKAHKLQREEVEEAYGEGSSRVITIPGKRRAIEKVRLQYKKHKLDASTRVQIYAR